MYNFLFWFFYKFFEWRKGFKSTFLSASMVGLAIIVHLGLLHAILRYLTGFNIGVFSNHYGYNRLILLPIVITWFFIMFQVYKRISNDILRRYNEKYNLNFKTTFYVALILIVPLIISIWLTNLAVEKGR